MTDFFLGNIYNKWFLQNILLYRSHPDKVHQYLVAISHTFVRELLFALVRYDISKFSWRLVIFRIAFLRVISLSNWAWQREITSRRGIYEAPLPVTARTPVLFIFIGLFFYISSAPVTQPQFSALFNSGQSLLSRQYRSGGINRDWKSLISLWRTTRRPRDDVILICNSEEVGHASPSNVLRPMKNITKPWFLVPATRVPDVAIRRACWHIVIL